jgi:hypothetical protein
LRQHLARRLQPVGAARCQFEVAAFRRERLGDSKANAPVMSARFPFSCKSKNVSPVR